MKKKRHIIFRKYRVDGMNIRTVVDLRRHSARYSPAWERAATGRRFTSPPNLQTINEQDAVEGFLVPF